MRTPLFALRRASTAAGGLLAALVIGASASAQDVKVTVVTAGSTYPVSAASQLVVFNKSTAGAVAVTLPSANAMNFSNCLPSGNSCPVIGIKDIGGSAVPIVVSGDVPIDVITSPPSNTSYTISTPAAEVEFVLIPSTQTSPVMWVVK